MRGLMDDIASALTADPILQADIHTSASTPTHPSIAPAGRVWHGNAAFELLTAAKEKSCLKVPFTPKGPARSLVTAVGRCLLSRLTKNASEVHAG